MGSFIACWFPFFLLYSISPVCPVCEANKERLSISTIAFITIHHHHHHHHHCCNPWSAWPTRRGSPSAKSASSASSSLSLYPSIFNYHDIHHFCRPIPSPHRSSFIINRGLIPLIMMVCLFSQTFG